MADRVISSRKEKFDREIAAYRGDDPLQLRYDFLLWLDSNYGKDKVIGIFTSTLEEALNNYWDDARYKEDNRLVELQMIYASLQQNPLTVYQSYYDRGIAQHSSVLYVNWANHLAAAGDFAGADKIFKMGSEKTSSTFKAELIKAFDKFLAVVGRKFLDGQISAENEVKCPKCHVQKQQPIAPPTTDDYIAIGEMNPGKAGCWEDFETAVAYFDPPDDKNIRMYPKDKVYKDAGKEYSLEEIKAAEYFEKIKKKEQLEAQKLKEITNKKSIMGFDPPFEIDPVLKEGAFPTPLLPCGKEDSISAQSFTTRTKLALHLVQDMWSSPTPEVPPPILAKTEEKTKPSFPIYMDENPETPKAAEKKPITPFQVYTDSPDKAAQNNKKQSTTKKGGLQTKPAVFSERKLKNEEIAEEPKAVARQQLNFKNDNANELLANKLSETSVSDPRTPFQPFGGFKPLFPVEQGKDDFSDDTCNTKAFNFALPSSTPVQERKSLAPYHSAQRSSGSTAPQDERPSYHTQQNLSVILEASKERCSSSGSSTTGSTQPHTPAFPVKTPLKTMSNFSNDQSGARSLPGAVHIGSTPGNRSFTWMSNRSANDSIKSPNRSLSNEDLNPQSAYSCSFLKFRLSSEKLTALKSIKENYFQDRSKPRLFKLSPLGKVSGSRSPCVPITPTNRLTSSAGDMMAQMLGLSISKNESNIPTNPNVMSHSQLGPPSTGINDQQILDSDSLKMNDEQMLSVSSESSKAPIPFDSSTNLRSSLISMAVGSKLIHRDPRVKNNLSKRKRKSYKQMKLSRALISESVESKSNRCSFNTPNDENKRKSSPHKHLSVSSEVLSITNTVGIVPEVRISPSPFDASSEDESSSNRMFNLPNQNHQNPRMEKRTEEQCQLVVTDCVSGDSSHCLPYFAHEIRECSIQLSVVNLDNMPTHSSSQSPQVMVRKCGRPRKQKRVSAKRKKSIHMSSDDSSLSLYNFRKRTVIKSLERNRVEDSTTARNKKSSQSQKKHRRNSFRTKSNGILNVNNNRKERMKRSSLAKHRKMRKSSSNCCPKELNEESLKKVKVNHKERKKVKDNHKVGMQNMNSYKTPINSKKIMVGSESCPAHPSEPVLLGAMVLRSHSRGSSEVFLRSKSYRGCSTPSLVSSPIDRYNLRSTLPAVDYVPKQLLMEDYNNIDPFCPTLNDKLLALVNFPHTYHLDGYQVVNSTLPSVSKNFRLGNDTFTTYGELGKGAYARVLKASIDNLNVALKIEKPACRWEFYIAKEIQNRVDLKARSSFMDINTAYIFSNGSVLVTEWAKHGSLLNIINQYKQQTGKVLEPVLSLHFAIEVTRAVESLHKSKIIHGDIKPDNFVVRSLPTVNETEPCLMLIDFGRSIDMSLFPEGTKFSRVVTTEGFQCNEMKENKPWTYQTDLYGLAGTIHCLLVGDYMRVVQKPDGWKLSKALPRNMRRDLWDPIFHQLLNVPSFDHFPNLTEIRETLEAAFDDFNHYIKLQYFNHLSNIVLGK